MRAIRLDLDKAMRCEEVNTKQIKTIACPPACLSGLGLFYMGWGNVRGIVHTVIARKYSFY
jgi:hypothetical protein